MAYIVADNKRREEINNNLVNKFYTDEEMVEHMADDKLSGDGYIDDKLPYTQTGNLPRSLKVKKNVPVMITVNSIHKRYKENGIVNGARAFIEDYELEDGTRKDKIIWVLFPDKETGSILRDEKRKKGIKHTNKLAVPIMEVKKTFQVRGTNIKATRKQFPLVLCFCMTSYKSQGQTLEAVIMDFKNSLTKHGQFYVAMTRVRSGEGLFVRNFDPSQILCRNDVKKELKILRTNRQYIFYKTFLEDKIWMNDKMEILIGYLNINGFEHNLENLDNDINLSKLDFLCIAETKLNPDINDKKLNEKLKNFEIIFRQDVLTNENVPHMGMLILKNKQSKKGEHDLVHYSVMNLTSSKKIQCAKLTIVDQFSVLFNYVNRTPEKHEVEKIARLLAEKDVTFIIGDFNLNPEKKEERERIKIIEKKTDMTFELEDKTRKNTTLDLVFPKKSGKSDSITFSYRNMYSDHATVGFRYCNGGILSEEYIDLQIKKQDKPYLRRATLDAMGTNSVKTENVEREEDAAQDEIIVRNVAAIVKESNLRKLSNDDWLDDELINCYLYQLQNKYDTFFRFSTFFHSDLQTKGLPNMKKRYQAIQLFNYSLWLIPVNYQDLHWFLLAVDTEDIKDKKLTIRVYDSLGDKKVQSKGIAEKQMESFINWKFRQIPRESKSKLKITLVNMADQIPKQQNDIDCGVFLLMYSKYLAAKENFNFGQHNMRQFRLRIKQEIENKMIKDFPSDMEEEMPWHEESLNDVENVIPKKISSNMKNNKNIKKEYGYVGEQINVPGSSDAEKAEGSSRRHHTRSVKDTKSRPSTKSPDPLRLRNQLVLCFENHGANLCFSNAVTSALLNILEIRRTAQDFATDGTFPNAFWGVLSRLAVKTSFQSSSTREFRRIVAQKCLADGVRDDFNDGYQHDAAEFMKHTIEHLFSETGRLSQLRHDIFTIQTKSYLLCTSPTCSSTTQLAVDTEEILPLAINGDSLYSCLNARFADEILERRCPEGCGNVHSRKISKTLRYPSNVIFQLKRWNNLREKINSEVMIPQQISLESTDEVNLYQLSWFICHIGNTPNSGHYICYLPDHQENSFTVLNDERISTEKMSAKIEKEVYMISYTKL